jgi:hypothetical protein
MAKKKSRKSRSSRRNRQRAERQAVQQAPRPSAREERATRAGTPAATVETKSRQVPARGTTRENPTDFMAEYAYVYHDLHETLYLAIGMFTLLVVTNLVLTYVFGI